MNLNPSPARARARALLLVAAAVVGAATIGTGAAASESPTAVVKDTIARLFSALDRAPGQPERVFEEVVMPRMDLDKVSRWVLGRHWREMSPAQRGEFLASFRTMIARSYVMAVAEHTDAEIEYLGPASAPQAGKATVRTRILRSGGPPLRIDYRLMTSAGVWKLVDIRVGGISLIASYRASFDAEIAAHGVDGLLRALARKAQGSVAEG